MACMPRRLASVQTLLQGRGGGGGQGGVGGEEKRSGTEKRCSHNLQSVHLGQRALFVIAGLLSGVFEC